MTKPLDTLIVGAGPIGIACGVEATQAGLSHLIIEKGCLTNAVYQFPTQLVFFSTPELLEIGKVPFITSGPKPTRRDILVYYRRVTENFKLHVNLYETVTEIRRGADDLFTVLSDKAEYHSRTLVLAIGFYDFPNMLDIPGEDLDKVSHYYQDPHCFYRRKVAVIGGQNSAAEAALELYRNGGDVTLIHRREGLGKALKYWVKPDIENRIAEGSIRAFFESSVSRIDEKTITVQTADGSEETVENDFVFAMTGYRTDLDFLDRLGIELEGEKKKPKHNPDTMETNVPEIYISGVAAGGIDTNRIFIENGREHAKLIMADIANKLSRRMASTS